MDNVVIESFIQHSDEMMIAEEGFGSKIMNGIKKGIQKLLELIRKLIQKIKSLKNSNVSSKKEDDNELDKENQIPEKAYNAYKKAMSEYNNILRSLDNFNLQCDSSFKAGKVAELSIDPLNSLVYKSENIEETFRKTISLTRSDEGSSMISLDRNYFLKQAESFDVAVSKLNMEANKMENEMHKYEHNATKNLYYAFKRSILKDKSLIYLKMVNATYDLILSMGK